MVHQNHELHCWILGTITNMINDHPDSTLYWELENEKNVLVKALDYAKHGLLKKMKLAKQYSK